MKLRYTSYCSFASISTHQFMINRVLKSGNIGMCTSQIAFIYCLIHITPIREIADYWGRFFISRLSWLGALVTMNSYIVKCFCYWDVSVLKRFICVFIRGLGSYFIFIFLEGAISVAPLWHHPTRGSGDMPPPKILNWVLKLNHVIESLGAVKLFWTNLWHGNSFLWPTQQSKAGKKNMDTHVMSYLQLIAFQSI
jgi:hypothetical protein